MTHQPAISVSISFQHPFNRAGGRTSNVRRIEATPLAMNPNCPKCGNCNFKIWRLPNWMLIHWILNPGLALNELILGQRLPKESLECKSCELPIGDRSYTVCPHCHEMHPSTVWAGRNAFRNWLGLVCPSCLHRIPCLWNVFSLLILAVTSPLWYLPYRFYFRDRQVLPPPAMASSPSQPVRPGKLLIRMAIFWGGFMWIMMSLIPEISKALRGQTMSYERLVVGLVVWTLAGLAFGGFMSYFLTKKKAQKHATKP